MGHLQAQPSCSRRELSPPGEDGGREHSSGIHCSGGLLYKFSKLMCDFPAAGAPLPSTPGYGHARVRCCGVWVPAGAQGAAGTRSRWDLGLRGDTFVRCHTKGWPEPPAPFEASKDQWLPCSITQMCVCVCVLTDTAHFSDGLGVQCA